MFDNYFLKHCCLAELRVATWIGLVLSLGFGTGTIGYSQTVKSKSPLPNNWTENVSFRSVGPAAMSGRITAIAVYEQDKNIWWAASASGGLLKTINNGQNFEHQFHDQGTVSIGDVQVAKTDAKLVWVGTGENNPRNSVSWGDGVYKSTDGGKSWKNMGLKKSFQIGRIAIHPEDHDVVYVGALGRLWGPNEERGLFKTVDGGKTWDKVLYVDEWTGVIDVQLNPANPEELLVATYERLRDGSDGNDPIKKFGAGSGIYKSVDGGKTFRRLSNGLPTCKLGRVGLCYFLGDPNYVAAIVESEQIAKEPDNAPFAGLRGANAEVGAKITQITPESPAAKAGLKENDVVISADGEIVHSYDDLLAAIRKRSAGQTLDLLVSRDRKPVDLTLELAKKPKRPAARNGNPRIESPTPFTGDLGGQQPNMQGQQGENEHEYGGVYLSSDGGETWKRINSLNPRPMYYSQIRIDPVDRQRMYVLGTLLYRSSDGGQTFEGDGDRGIHPDHHGLWIDPADPRHMILGNDGGIYVTYDRMDNWDHHNHVAIGQFYHVGIDSRADYKVYGGLQDNGSWGGPVRVANDSGTTNGDWFMVGGGDGFITLVDPDDPDQIYFESQNGGMGRINLRTGERGFIQPRPPRGTRYRFNWKTPYILSPHNSKIHYSGGNYVFRSFNKGRDVQPISPEISNTDEGSASAISESPVKAGLIYVGTTDGAVWVTRNGGQEWEPVFVQRKEKKTNGKADPEKVDANQINPNETAPAADEKPGSRDVPVGQTNPSDQPADAESKQPTGPNRDQPADPEKTEAPSPLDGTWNGNMISDRFPAGQAPSLTLTLKVDADGEVSGEIETPRGPQPITSGKYDPQTGELSVMIESQRGRREFSAIVKGTSMSGKMSMRDGQFQVEFQAEKQEDPKQPEPAHNSGPDWIVDAMSAGIRTESGRLSRLASTAGLISPAQHDFLAITFNPIAWIIRGNQESQADQEAEGNTRQSAGQQPGYLGVQLDENGKIVRVLPDSAAELAGIQIGDAVQSIGGIQTGSAQQVIDSMQTMRAGDSVKIELLRNGEPLIVEATLKARPARPVRPRRPESDSQTEQLKTKMPDESASPGRTPQEAAAPSPDQISGAWEGTISTPQGESSLKLVLTRQSDQSITGSYETERGSGEISDGVLESETLTLSAFNENFNLEFRGRLEADTYEGEIDINGGAFSMQFQTRRVADVQQAESAASAPESKPASDANQPLAELLPGPRWVSSLHASKFNADRCYISLDGHRSDDDKPYLFVTEDAGKTWRSLQGNLPDSAGSVRVLREDIKNQNVLYLGCEFGGWVSVDRGANWYRLANLPTVAVHEFAQHPSLDDVVVATHGRSLWVGDVCGLRQLNAALDNNAPFLFQPRDVTVWRNSPVRGSSGTRKFVSANPRLEAKICYWLPANANSIDIEIRDLKGELIKRFEDPIRAKGLHELDWDLRRSSSARNRFSPRVANGEYLVNARIDGKLLQVTLTVRSDPSHPIGEAVEVDYEFEWWRELSENGGKP